MPPHLQSSHDVGPFNVELRKYSTHVDLSAHSHWMNLTISQLQLNVVSSWQALTIWTQGPDGTTGASGTRRRCQPITGNHDFSSAS